MWVTFSGTLSLGRLTRAHQNYLAHPDYHQGIEELLDFRDASIGGLRGDEVRMMRHYVQGQPEAMPGRNVMVVSTALEFGIGRMIASMIEQGEPLERHVAYSVEDALEWLRPGKSAELLALYEQRAGQTATRFDLTKKTA